MLYYIVFLIHNQNYFLKFQNYIYLETKYKLLPIVSEELTPS